jgi:hypothetical protein
VKKIEVNIGELFEKFLEAKEGEREGKKTEIPVGTVSKETIMKFKAWKRAKQLLDDEIEIEEERLAKEFRRRMLDTFEDKTEEITNHKNEIWQEIYKELGIDKKEGEVFVINATNGEVSKEVKKNDLFGNKSYGLQ